MPLGWGPGRDSWGGAREDIVRAIPSPFVSDILVGIPRRRGTRGIIKREIIKLLYTYLQLGVGVGEPL